ncbi:MAG: hypothetical protein LBU94_00565 [Clostridiales bacterium]|jgi:hypothetical protein|nr:hypothetical protein [Clostridiales bacterium]
MSNLSAEILQNNLFEEVSQVIACNQNYISIEHKYIEVFRDLMGGLSPELQRGLFRLEELSAEREELSVIILIDALCKQR